MNKKNTTKFISILVFVCLLFLVPLFIKSNYWLHVLIITGINVLLAVSLRALAHTGQISMGTAGFMLIGAYSSALLAINLGLSFWLALPLGGLVAAIIALAAGYPFLKAKGIYFAILTVMLAEVFRLIAWYWKDLTGGSGGLQYIPAPDPINILGLILLTFTTKVSFYYLMLVILIISLIILYRTERSWLGLMWSSINEADILARAVGINIMFHKILIFAVSSFFMGIAGALYAHYMGSLSPYGIPGSVFGFTASIYVLLYVVVGGEARFAGPIIGAFLLTMVSELARSLREYMPLLFGGLLILVVFLMPQGITGLGAQLSGLYYRLRHQIMKTSGD
jgi:branched-chain amino acid transport system permease protein